VLDCAVLSGLEFRSELERAPSTIVLRHVDALDDASWQMLAALLDTAALGAKRLVATALPSFLDSRWARLFPVSVEVPSLNDRVDELPRLVRALMRRYGAAGEMQAPALYALTRYPWRGNMRELEDVIRAACSGRRTCDLTLRDLPTPYRSGGRERRLSPMERIERAAIAKALEEADGNRTLAAAKLEIGRTTLYRKIHAYGLEADA
jgi:transcriptional regulator of acetoin/glycerol metabolism